MAKKKKGIEWLLSPYYNLRINSYAELDDKVLIDFYNETMKNSPSMSEKDVLWTYFNYVVTLLSNDDLFSVKTNRKLSGVYGIMYRFRWKHDKVVDRRLHQLSLEYEIKSLDSENNSFSRVLSIIGNDCFCGYCREMSNTLSEITFDYSYFQTSLIIDSTNCEKSGFIPLWSLALRPKRDKNGNVIRSGSCDLINTDFGDSKNIHKNKEQVRFKKRGCLSYLVFGSVVLILSIVVVQFFKFIFY